jgi:hypothetical protein
MIERSLDAHLARHVVAGGDYAAEIAATIALLAQTGVTLAETIAEGQLAARWLMRSAPQTATATASAGSTCWLTSAS